MLAWLRCKVKVLRNALVDSSASFAGLGSDSLTIYAIGLLGEYLSEEWTKRLADSCHVSLGLLLCLACSQVPMPCLESAKHRTACQECGNEEDRADCSLREVHLAQISRRRRCSLSNLIRTPALMMTGRTKGLRYAHYLLPFCRSPIVALFVLMLIFNSLEPHL